LILGDFNDVTFYAYQPPPPPNDVTFYDYQPNNTIAINSRMMLLFMLISRRHQSMMFILMLISPTI
jgi:hypothetical protein